MDKIIFNVLVTYAHITGSNPIPCLLNLFEGVVGMRGIIYDPKEIQIVKYAWGLGNVSNNMIESYSQWCGLVIAKEARIKKLIVLGDSPMVK